jgi:hypothetical protein
VVSKPEMSNLTLLSHILNLVLGSFVSYVDDANVGCQVKSVVAPNVATIITSNQNLDFQISEKSTI